MSVEGDDPACRVGKGIIADLEAHPLEIETDGKVLYHAAAVVASNYLVVLMDIALAMMESAGVARKRAFGILEPLVAGTLANLSEKETRKALTGPVARGRRGDRGRPTASLADKLPETAAAVQATGQSCRWAGEKERRPGCKDRRQACKTAVGEGITAAGKPPGAVGCVTTALPLHPAASRRPLCPACTSLLPFPIPPLSKYCRASAVPPFCHWPFPGRPPRR
jgi:hypothetical protein